MHIADEDFELYVRGRLTESASALVASHAESCEECSQRLNETTEFIRRLVDLSQRQALHDGEEKRRELRTSTNDLGSLQVINPLSVDRRGVKIVDVSKAGLKLFSADYYQAGTIVQVHLRDTFILGEVRYCNPVRGGFHVGIRVQSVA
jgi:hypothetical protein